jgi:catechol 2,3-dioxygenase-like lactoylglutathione lyase family enzyme
VSGEEALRAGTVEIGIVVNDLDAAREFYGEVLGLEYVGDLALPGGTMKRFQHGDAVVKLLQLDKPPARANPPGGLFGDASGLRYLTVRVPQVDETVARCRAAGSAVPVPTFEFRPGLPVAIVEDPEGNWVELTQARRD